MYFRYGGQSDQGRVRTSNEDSYAASAKNRLFLVADGMGGHAAGEIASQIAASTVEEIVVTRSRENVPVEEALRAAVEEANARIYRTQRTRPELAGMGSTVTVLSFASDKYHIAHVGDSRAYLLRDGFLSQLTRDHSLVWHLFESGVLKKEDLSTHPQKNLITRSIGPHPEVEVDIEEGEVREGDVYLLCSDGLADVVPEDGIRELLSNATQSPQEICQALVRAANTAGGPDNVTVVVVRLEPGEPEEDEDENDTDKFRVR